MRKVALMLAVLLLVSLFGCSTNHPPESKTDYVFVGVENGVAISYYPASIKVTPEYIIFQVHEQPQSPTNKIKYGKATMHLRPEGKLLRVIDRRLFDDANRELDPRPKNDNWHEISDTVYDKLIDAVLDYCRANNLQLFSYPGPEFQYLGTTMATNCSYFYDPRTFKALENYIAIQIREEHLILEKGLKYIIYTANINPSEKRFRVVSIKGYDATGKQIDSIPDGSWDSYIVGSPTDHLAKIGLEYFKKNNIAVNF